MDIIAQAIGQRIERYLDEQNVSKEELAELLEISPKTVGNWIGGRNVPQTKHRETLADIMSISVDELMDPSIVHREEKDQEMVYRARVEKHDGMGMQVHVPTTKTAKDAMVQLNKMIPDVWWDDVCLYHIELEEK